jgi:predicted dehydrogenase
MKEALLTPTRRMITCNPRLGFAGVGWIGRNRLEAISATGVGEIAALVDPDPGNLSGLLDEFPAAVVADDFDDLLEMELDGIVIATPSALHCDQATAALERGVAVFCQKPLGRNESECLQVIDAARASNRLLGVDLSYRHTAGMRAIREAILEGRLGEIRSIEAVFHNAYGPGKPWFYQRSLSGGGCLLDLGIHLVDLALWCTGFPEVLSANSHFYYANSRGSEAVEEHASGLVVLQNDISLQLACSWNAPAGCDAEIGLRIFGTEGGAHFHNVNGSFYDFSAKLIGADRSVREVAAPPDEWGGRAAVAWARQLDRSPDFDPSIETIEQVARVLDLLYANGNA